MNEGHCPHPKSRSSPSHEARQPDGSGQWSESLRLDAVGADADGTDWAIATQIARVPGAERMEFVAVVLSSGALPVVVVECDISIPARGWEIRASGLWADHVCEKPLAHWSYGLEAFALAVESGTELEPDGRGERVPLGWELEFEADGDPEWSTGEESWHGYVQFGQVHGLLLDADGETEFTGAGTRGHWWGEERPATAGTRRQASLSGESVSARGGQDRVAVRYQHQLARAETTLCDGVLLTVWTPDEALENRPDSLG